MQLIKLLSDIFRRRSWSPRPSSLLSHAEERGINADPEVDLAGMVGWRATSSTSLLAAEKLCKVNKVNLLEGNTTFANENAVWVSRSGEGQGSEHL